MKSILFLFVFLLAIPVFLILAVFVLLSFCFKKAAGFIDKTVNKAVNWWQRAAFWLLDDKKRRDKK